MNDNFSASQNLNVHGPELSLKITNNTILAVFVTDNGVSGPKPEAYNWTKVNSNASIDLSGRIKPYSVPITLTNTQQYSTPVSFQQMLDINSRKFPLINSNWTNVNFTDSTGEPLQAWVESNATNSSAHTVVWVKLNQTISGNSNILIFMNILPYNVMSANGPTGEAPTLSPEYAEYDNGRYVFDHYDDFLRNNSIIDQQIFGLAGSNWTVDNGLTFTGSVRFQNANLTPATYENTNIAVDTFYLPEGYSICSWGICVLTPTGYEGWTLLSGNTTCRYYDGFMGWMQPNCTYGVGVLRADENSPYPEYFFTTINGVSTVSNTSDTLTSPVSFALYNGKVLIQSRTKHPGNRVDSLVTTQMENVSEITGDEAFTLTGGWDRWNNPTPVSLSWIRTRNTPPNGVMPNVTTFGHFLEKSTETYSGPIERSNSVAVTARIATTDFAVPPYTYFFSVVNSLSKETIQTATVITNATSCVQNFTIGANDLANFPEVVNVVVTDSDPDTTSSSYSAPLFFFKTVNASLSAYGNTNSVDQGGIGTWMTNSTGITGPYDINASVYSSNGLLVLTRNLTYQHAQSSINIPIPANLTPGTYELNVTLNGWMSAIDSSYIGSGTNSTLFTVNPKMVAGLPNANATVVTKGSNVTLYANVSGGASPYLHYVWFYGTDRNCTTDLQEPWNWTSNGGTKDINYDANASDSFSIRINSTTYACYAVQDSTGAWALSNTTSVDVYHPNVTLTIYNNQSVPTAAEFQQMVRINSTDPIFQNLSYDGGNVRFFSGDTELYSWRENATLFWIRLPGEMGSGSIMEVNMTFLPKGTEFDGAYAGEAPQLSSTYGRYDNGALMFPALYQNFTGTDTPSGWTAYSGSATIDNGLIIAFTSGTNNRFWTDSDYGLNSSQILDFYGSISGSGVGFTNTEFGYVKTGGPAAGWGISGSTLEDMTGGTQGNVNPSGLNHIFSTYWPSSSSSSFDYDYGTMETLTTGLPSSQYPIGGITWSSNGGTINIHWVRIRVYPPDGVMPSVSFSG